MAIKIIETGGFRGRTKVYRGAEAQGIVNKALGISFTNYDNTIMNKNWFKCKDTRPFIDIALFSADFWGHSYWSHDETANELHYILHFVDDDILPEELCKVGPDEALELFRLIEKYGYDKENYLAVQNWAAERSY